MVQSSDAQLRVSFIPLAVPDISDEDVDAVVRVLRSGMLVQGENVEALEEFVAESVGANYAVAVANGTAALHLSLVALGIGPGDKVIVPAFSFVATANVVELVGARCVFVDIEPGTWNIDPDQLERAIGEGTRAIIPVHEFGLPCAIDRVTELARWRGLAVVEDAACALGAGFRGRKVGTFGDTGCFSLHPRKAITSGEGGLLITNDPKVAARVRALRNHGLEMRGGRTKLIVAGFNYRLTDFQAALVLGQAKRIDASIAQRASFANLYRDLLADEQWLVLPQVPEGHDHSWQSFHVLLQKRLDRNAVIAALRDRGIGSNLGGQCIPEQLYYRQTYGYNAAQLFPNAHRAYRSGLALPLHGKMTLEQVEQVVVELRAVIQALS